VLLLERVPPNPGDVARRLGRRPATGRVSGGRAALHAGSSLQAMAAGGLGLAGSAVVSHSRA